MRFNKPQLYKPIKTYKTVIFFEEKEVVDRLLNQIEKR